ncbi:thiamine phosphate synthase [Salipaludibacillus sp. CUR1]|uniref:thiamine phosphate synthase n=1 Tax=Salipaludibacillus sp. CUR1 TaxID=2820003 RepID=UPI001E53AAF8|nr:thiamine phosphate synthase [Salipaludibacillus sp. CUR1]MCE7791621.1 thiamine phosphate synthase [Salipaludibacillus sp. CUR1]
MIRRDPVTLKKALKVYFICGTPNVSRPLTEILKEAIHGGATIFQFREKGVKALTGEKKKEQAAKLQAICLENGIPFIINDDVELAVELNADGVHVGQDDTSAREVRAKIGPDKILGVSAHSLTEAVQAEKDGADYIGVGPVFVTSSKDDAEEVCGPERISEFREEGLNLPIVAIGGITFENTPAVIRAGADGVSVISAIASSASPADAANKLYRKASS